MVPQFLKDKNVKEAPHGFSHLPSPCNRLVTGLATPAVRGQEERGQEKSGVPGAPSSAGPAGGGRGAHAGDGAGSYPSRGVRGWGEEVT